METNTQHVGASQTSRSAISVSDFEQRVERLVEKREGLERAESDSKLRLLDFCQDYFVLAEDAKLDKQKTACLDEHIQTRYDWQKQAFKTIGEHAPVLKKYVVHLPASQESLKELARVIKGHPDAIGTWIANGELTSSTAVADVRALRQSLKPKTNEEQAEEPPTYEIALTAADKEDLLERFS